MAGNRLKLQEVLANKEILENLSFFALIELAKSACSKFSALIEAKQYPKSLLEDEITVDVEEGTMDLTRAFAEPGKGYFAYTPPEYIRGDAEADGYFAALYPLAVLIYRIFHMSFPYEGKKWLRIVRGDPDKARLFYRDNPDFVFATDTDANRPLLGKQNDAICYWTVYPEFFRNKFHRVFQNNERISVEEWNRTLSELAASLNVCEHCGAEIFYPEPKRALCWRCREECVPQELELIENGALKTALPLRPGTCYEEGKLRFEVVLRGARWGVKNASETPWKWMRPGGKTMEILKNEAVPVSRGMLIRLKSNQRLALVPAGRGLKAGEGEEK